ncbi:MAG TPA: DUF3014 domain-containing protein [Vicinamibacterales bacterium]
MGERSDDELPDELSHDEPSDEELSDYKLEKSDDESAQSDTSKPLPRLAWIAPVIVAAGVLAYFWFPRTPEAPAPTAPTVAYRPLPAPTSAPAAINVPPLDESDDLVRRLVAALSSHPRVAAWLAGDDLIRNFTVAVENIANGTVPTRHLRVLRPTGPFRVVADGEAVRIDPRSYERYNGVTDAVRSVDAAGAATLYSTLKPRIEEAYRELGHNDAFDAALQRAIAMLVRTPVTDGNVPVVYKGALNMFANPRLEELTAPQKQLLRMGPRNARLIQDKLREIAAAIGIAV